MSTPTLPPMPSTDTQDVNQELNAGLQNTPANTALPTTPQGVPMISPDRTDTRIVPAEQQSDAATAGWEHATKMVHPVTQDKRWVPASQISDAMKAGYVNTGVPAALTSKPGEQFQGLGSAAKDMALGLVTPQPVVMAQQAYKGITEDIPAVYKAYEAARSTGASITDAFKAANAKAQQINDAKDSLKSAVKEFTDNPNKAAWNAVLQLGTVALGGELLKAPTAEMATAEAVAPEAAEAAAEAEPGIMKQVLRGKAVNQPGTESAIRSAVQKGTEATGTAEESMAANIDNQPIAKGNQTVVDEQLNALRQKEVDAYKSLDETAGFDLKAEKAQLANDKYKLSQLGNTDTDVQQRGNLIEAINDSTDRIAEAETKLKAADIDPKLGDTIHQQRMATQDIRKMLVKNTGADGSLNVKGLLNDSKNLRNSKYGDRLAQAWGSDTADAFQSRLQQMEKLSAHAVTARWAAGIIGYEAIKHTLGSTGGTAAKIATELPL